MKRLLTIVLSLAMVSGVVFADGPISFPVGGGSSGGSYSGNATSVTDNLIVNADINSAAGIVGSKLADNTIGRGKIYFSTAAGYMDVAGAASDDSVSFALRATSDGLRRGRLHFYDAGDIVMQSYPGGVDMGQLGFYPAQFKIEINPSPGYYLSLMGDNVSVGAGIPFIADNVQITGGAITLSTPITASEFVSLCVPGDNDCYIDIMNSGALAAASQKAGRMWVDNTTNCVSVRNNDNTVSYSAGCMIKTFSFAIDNVTSAAADNVLLTRVPIARTILRWDCSASVDNVVGNFMECATDNVISCGVVDAATVGGATRTDAPTTDSTITDAAIAAGAWLRWSTTSVGTAAMNRLSCTIQYRE